MKEIKTKYPNEIDERIFFQDINIDQVPIMKNFYSILNTGDYDRASELLNNSEVFFYGAWLLNVWEERLNLIGNYLMELDNPQLTVCQNTEPITLYQGMNWID